MHHNLVGIEEYGIIASEIVVPCLIEKYELPLKDIAIQVAFCSIATKKQLFTIKKQLSVTKWQSTHKILAIDPASKNSDKNLMNQQLMRGNSVYKLFYSKRK